MLRFPLLSVAMSALLTGACVSGGDGDPSPRTEAGPPGPGAGVLRVAMFNVEELSADKVDAVDGEGRWSHSQLEAAAAIIRTLRPDILVLQEVDHDHTPGATPDRIVRDFQARYLETAGGEGPPIAYEHLFLAPVNTGVLSGLDLDGDGTTAAPEHQGTDLHGQDSWGYGRYPGQYGMAVLSRFPIDAGGARTFQRFLWRDLPGHHIPEGYYHPEVRDRLRLSSKSHWDVPIETPAGLLHLWVSHPTPPAFDGPEERNRRRNHDEIAFWIRYLEGDPALYDDAGGRGGRGAAPFVVAGDLNADPEHPAADYGVPPAIVQLLGHPDIQDTGEWTRSASGGPNTATFLGGRRVDYVLADARLRVVEGGVHWPDPAADPAGAARAEAASDHRMVWIDLALPLLPGAGTSTPPRPEP